MNPQKLSEVCLFSLAHLVFLFIVLSGTDAPGEQVLYETLHTKLGMENLDVEEVRLCWISSPDDFTFQQVLFPPLQVLVYLQVCRNISLVFLGDWQKVTDHVCAVTKALSKRPYRFGGRAEQTPQRSIRCQPSPSLSFSFQAADRATGAAVLLGGFVGQRSSCGERRIRAGAGLEEPAAAAEQS